MPRSRCIPIAKPNSPANPLHAGRLLACTFGHAVADSFANFVPPLMYTIRAMFGLADSHVGLISQLFSLTTNFGQPVFGYVADRWQVRNVIPIGVAVAAVFMCVLGFAPNLFVFVGFLMVAGLGIALFHPRGGALAAEASGSRRAFGMSIFGAGGAIGYAIASLASPLLHTWGLNHGLGPLQGLVLALPAGLLAVVLLARFNPQGPPRDTGMARFSLRRDLFPHLPKLSPLFAVMVLRSGTITAYATFFQVLQGERGVNELSQGGVLFAFVAGGAIGGIVGGHLSDLYGRRSTTIVSLLSAPALLWLALYAGYWPAIFLLFVGGFTLRGAESVNIAQTQDLLPGGMSTASAISMGFVWGVAGVVPPLVGLVSDACGSLAFALSLTLVLPVIAAGIAVVLPTRPPVEEA